MCVDKDGNVCFGKYKGKPVEEMIRDTNYMNWLNDQIWYREKMAPRVKKYQQQVEHPNKDHPTPAHNRLQNKFLDQEFIRGFRMLFEEKLLTNDPPHVVFEEKFGWDVILRSDYRTYRIELKTTVGDEYPCILRKMAQQYSNTQRSYSFVERYKVGRPVLLIANYYGETSWNDLVKIFKTQNITVLHLNDVIEKMKIISSSFKEKEINQENTNNDTYKGEECI